MRPSPRPASARWQLSFQAHWCPQQTWPLRCRLHSSSSSPGRNHVMPEAGLSRRSVSAEQGEGWLVSCVCIQPLCALAMCARGVCGAAGEDPGTEGVSGEEREVGREGGAGPGVPAGRVSSASSLFWPLSRGPAGACLIRTCRARLSCAGRRTGRGAIPTQKHLTPGPPTCL